ncbi:MAG: acyl-CoA thioesterase [Desulfocapsaceae bacterium]|nr:acyl-CoA thioesterase [Desulfocapsaceae bacterium]
MFTAIQRIRVEWAHCDPAGIIFNPHYYIWMDGGTHAMFQAAGFDLPLMMREDRFFRGFPLVASNMAFKRPLHYRDITELTSKVEQFGNTSFVVAHAFRQGDDLNPVAIGNEVRVWGYSDQADSAVMAVRRVPEDVRSLLSVNQTVDTTVK